MKTRKDYLDGKCTHSEYYAQFVADVTKSSVLSRFSRQELKAAYENNKHFNSIPLKEWDNLQVITAISFESVGDSCTLAGLNCVKKQAAKQLINY